MDLLDKLRAVEKRLAVYDGEAPLPGLTVIDRVLGPCEVVVDGRPTLMFGSNNYLGLTLHPAVIAFRHNSPDSLRKKLERLPAGQRNRLVVVEGLYSIRGDVAPLADIVSVCRAHGAYLLVDEAHSVGTYGKRGLGCAEAQGVL